MLEDSLIPSDEIDENIEIVEELPTEPEGEIIEEEIPEEITENNEDNIISESVELELLEEADPVPDELTENSPDELNEVQSDETDLPVTENSQVGDQADHDSYEEEILRHIETLTISVGVIQTNCKTGIENLQTLSTCSLGINCMIFGGFVIFCFLNRLG